MPRLIFVLSFLLVIFQSAAQENPFVDTLRSKLSVAKTSKEKVQLLGELSQFYIAVDRKQSDDYAAQQMQLAEESRDRSLIIRSHLSNAQRYYNFSTLQENINRGMQSSRKALQLAKESHLLEEEAWANIYLALGSRLGSEYDQALNYNNAALSLALPQKNDSLTVSAYLSMGNTYMRKNDKMPAFRNYLEATNLAERADKFTLLKNSYTSLSTFYSSLDDFERAKDYMYKVLAVTKRFNKQIERLDSYNGLGKVYTLAKQYDMAMKSYDRALALADSLRFDLIKLNTYSAVIDMYFNGGQMAKGLAYLNSKPELKNFVLNSGFGHNLDQAYGAMYTSMNRLDSAEYYLKRAEPVYERNGNRVNLFWFYGNMSTLHSKKGDHKKALAYSQKAEAIAQSIGDIELMRVNSQDLDSVYQQLGDFKNAYRYNRMHQTYKDSLEHLSTEKDLMLLDVENENKRKEREMQIEEQHTRDRHNIQYMGITAAIAGVFILLVMLGIFKVSHATIRILGFFAFIFLFEFLILIADNQIHHWTHGEPWKILAIKIGLISVLLPLHHYLEEKVIHYLTSKKLIEINKEALLSKFVSKKESHH